MPSTFDPVADYYDRARPDYPVGIYDALESEIGPLGGLTVVDIGAGTGIASRQLLQRGARVVAVDVGESMVRRADERQPRPSCVVADGNSLPIRDAAAHLACFAQAWHWFDPTLAGTEVARILLPHGYWAAWWSQPRADGEPWFDEYQDYMEGACEPYDRRHRDVGTRHWSELSLASTGLFDEVAKVNVPWVRTVSIDAWMDDERSKSYVEQLAVDDRADLLANIARIISDGFPTGEMTVAYSTHMWIARRR